MKKWVSDNKIKYKHLAGGVEFTDAIPKNPSSVFRFLSCAVRVADGRSCRGKLLRRQLRDQYKAKTKKAKM